VTNRIAIIFEEGYRELRPQTPIPELSVEFYSFAGVSNTIRMRRGRLLVRVSDLLECAPVPVLRSLAHILLAKLYRLPIDPAHSLRYRSHVSGKDFSQKARLMRQIRGKKRLRGPDGAVYHLDEIFDDLNARFFHGLLGRPRLSWSQNGARSSLGHYDPAHNAIVISRVFDSLKVPRYAVEYIVYHEMLHLKHPVKVQRGRRCVHSADFRLEEKQFPQLDEARKFLRRL
jgi:hypothetical protein